MDFVTLLTVTNANTMLFVSNMCTRTRSTRALKLAVGNYIAVNNKRAHMVSKMSYHAGKDVFDLTTSYADLTPALDSEMRRHIRTTVLKSDSVETALLNYLIHFGRYALSLLPGYGNDQVNELMRRVIINLINHFDK